LQEGGCDYLDRLSHEALFSSIKNLKPIANDHLVDRSRSLAIQVTVHNGERWATGGLKPMRMVRGRSGGRIIAINPGKRS